MNKKIGDSFMKLEYELITEENINLATSIQHTIFEEECAYIHYKFAIDTHYKENIFYIIRWNGFPVGVIGLYMHDELDKNSIWLGWFGVLPEFRSKGIGRKSLLDMIEKSKEYGKKFFRLYTNDSGDSTARPLYRSVMQIFEKYDNADDYNYNGNCLVYSYSLCNEKVKLWDNRFMNLKEDIEDEQTGNDNWKNKFRILILSNPNNEEFIEDEYIATAFRKDGHLVTMKWIDYEEELDESFDIIIRRNTWIESEEETKEYKIKNDKLKERLKKKNIKELYDSITLQTEMARKKLFVVYLISIIISAISMIACVLLAIAAIKMIMAYVVKPIKNVMFTLQGSSERVNTMVDEVRKRTWNSSESAKQLSALSEKISNTIHKVADSASSINHNATNSDILPPPMLTHRGGGFSFDSTNVLSISELTPCVPRFL